MTDIRDFLAARLAEDQAAAEATTPVPIAGHWRVARDKHAGNDTPLRLVQGADPYKVDDAPGPGNGDYGYGLPVIVFSADWQDEAEANLRHVARHDPARVLRDVEAKRHVLARHHAVGATLGEHPDDSRACHGCGPNWQDEWRIRDVNDCPELRDAASSYADHPDYDPAWSVT